jgi:hypothetical protein
MANIHEHAVLSDILVPDGSGFIGKDGDEFLMANNAQWVGFSMEIGPDGGMYVLDWHDADICGQEVLLGETGRVFRIMPEKSLAKNWEGRYDDLNKLSDQQLVALQTSSSDWHSRRARGILQKRASQGSLNQDTKGLLKKMFDNNKNPDHRLRAMWGVHLTGGFTEKELIQHLSDKDPHVRAWAIQLLCEDYKAPSEALTKFTTMAKSDPSPVVRLYLANSLQRIPVENQWLIAQALVTHAEDETDHNLPKMIWYGIEHLIEEDPEKFIAMATQSKLPMISRFMARRAVDGDQTDKLVAVLARNPGNQVHLLEGMLSGMEGRTDLEIPGSWPALAKKLGSNKTTQLLSQSISELFGDVEATKRAFTTLSNKQAPIDQRISALRTLAAQQRPELAAKLPDLINEKEIRIEAIIAIAGFDQESLGRLLIKNYPNYSMEEKKAAVETLSSRSRYGNLLAQEIKAERIPKREIPANIARQLLRVVGSGFIEIWGPIEQVAHDKAAYEKYQSLLTADALSNADLRRGKSLFQQTCGSCHKMFGEGADLGDRKSVV